MGAFVDITAADGHQLAAYLATPPGKPRGALVVVQTAFGVDDYLRGVCDAYAGEGYAAIAPALYDRQQRNAVFEHTPEGGKAAGALRNRFVWADVLKDVEAARLRVKDFRKVGILGFCVGGSIVWFAAQKLDFACGSSYYGKDIVDFLQPAPKCPVIMHFGAEDHLIPLADVEKIRSAYPEVPNYVYAAGHGFDSKEGEPTRAARSRTRDLFAKFIG